MEIAADKQIKTLLKYHENGFPLELDESNIVKINDNQRMIHVGKQKVYHGTTIEAAKIIMESKTFIPGTHGMFGPGIYFASTPRIAKLKVKHANKHAEVFIECMVDFGDALVLEKPDKDSELEKITKYNCNSILGRSRVGRKWEFVIF